MLICVVNESTLCPSPDVSHWVDACAVQAQRHAAPAWDLSKPSVLFVDTLAHVPAWAPFVVLLDTPGQAGALGYHTEAPNGRVYGRVFAKPTLDNQVTVSSVLSHEILEMLGDPAVNAWRQANDGRLWALELCDPVESTGYTIPVNGALVEVSDFVLPSFFDDAATSSKKTSFVGLHGAFRLAKGGYAVVMAGGKMTQILGDEYPEWRLTGKEFPAARTERRLAMPDGCPGVTS